MPQKEITFDKFIRYAGLIALVIFVLYTINYLSAVLIPFFVAWVFAYLLYPIVKFIENKSAHQSKGIGHHPDVYPGHSGHWTDCIFAHSTND